MSYLVDTSALTRILRHQADPAWDDFEERGLLSVAEPALAETLKMAQAKEYSELEETIQGAYPAVFIPDQVWEQVALIRRELAAHGAHRGLSVADLVIAALAIRLRLTVLHEDRDFETVARFVPELKHQWLRDGPSQGEAMSVIDA